jgi:hypothetical protein
MSAHRFDFNPKAAESVNILKRCGASIFPAGAQDVGDRRGYIDPAEAMEPRRNRRPNMYRKTLLAIAASFMTLSAFSGTIAILNGGTAVAQVA